MLGLTFKRDTDDERDSLSPKLIRLLERELADVAVCDPHVPIRHAAARATPSQDADVVIVATNHSEFERPEALRQIARAAPRRLPARRSLERARHRRRCSLFAAESAALPGAAARSSIPKPR